MANLKFSPNISEEVKKRTEEFFDLVYKKHENQDKSSKEYKEELLAREDELLTLVKNIIDFKAFDDNGYTALIWAATKGYTKVVEALIKAGADVNAKNNFGSNSLILAATGGHTEVVKALIAAGADLNDRNTALMRAAQEGHTEIVEALIAAGANIYLADKYSKTAKYYIKEKLGEDYYNKLLDKATQFYKGYKTSTECPNNVEDVLKLLAFHPIAPSDNREPFPKMKILKSMFWNKDWGLDQAYNLIDALKERKVINEDESAKLIESCKYKIAAQYASQKQARSDENARELSGR